MKEIITRELRALGRLGLIKSQGAGRYTVVDGEGLRRLAGKGRELREAPRSYTLLLDHISIT